MPDWFKFTDAIGPEKIVYLHDPDTGMKGIIVVDTMNLAGAGGGTRMLPDITTEEMFGLARAMTYKFAMLDLPVGGSKAGIWADPGMPREQKDAVLKAFGRLVKPIIESGVTVASDMGTDTQDVETIYAGAGLDNQTSGLSLQEKDGEPLENHATGYGVVVAARAACEFAGIDIRTATVAIEGFGKAGGGVARYIEEAGAKVVAMSNIDGTVYNKDGLDIPSLLAARETSGDRALSEYKDGEHLSKQDIFALPVDILVPGARPYVIHNTNADTVQAKVISSIANNPVTDEADQVLFQKDVLFMPDFLSNAGGVVIAILDLLGGTEDDLFRSLDALIGPLTKEILTDAKKEKSPARILAMNRIKEKIINIRSKKTEPLPFDEVLNLARERFGL
jgi:glutamate dehydrogenase (NAD(P)+)/glutamate dehydrogenase (NADP+)